MNKRRAKKIIKAVAEDIFYDAYVMNFMLDDKHEEELANLMAGIIDWRNDNIKKLSHIDGKNDPKLVKAYFRSVNAKAKKEINKIASRLSELSEEIK